MMEWGLACAREFLMLDWFFGGTQGLDIEGFLKVRVCGSDPTTLLIRFAEELRRVGQKYECAKDQAGC